MPRVVAHETPTRMSPDARRSLADAEGLAARLPGADPGALDGIAVVVTGLQAAFLFAFPWVAGRFFQSMFADFGMASPLPLLTRLVLTVWFPVILGATTAAGPVLGCIPAVPVAVRRRALIAAFVCGCAAIGACVVGLYLPIFELAGKIKAE